MPPLYLSTSELINLVLLSICCNFALVFAIFIAFLDISIPVPTNFGLSFNKDINMHPDPVPISKICNLEFLKKSFNTCSIISSVSGLGISTLWST